jgi:hypothetical protein
MSIVYRIDNEKGIIFAVWDGAVTEDELLAHMRRLTLDPGWPSRKRMQLTDLRTTTAYTNIDETSLKKLVAFLGKSRDKIAKMKIALVASEAYHISNVFQHLMADFPLSIIAFNSLDTACTWLGISALETGRTLEQLRAEARGGAGQQGKS